MPEPRLTTCPECSAEIPRRRPSRPRYGMTSMVLFIVAGAVTVVWALFLSVAAPGLVTPRPGVAGRNSLLLSALIFLAPGLLIALIAASIPKIRVERCYKCGWHENVQV